MMDSLLARLASEVPGKVPSEILRILGLYFCRIIDSETTKRWVRVVAAEDQIDPILEIKYSLDDSSRCNNYWRAIHGVSHYKRPPKAAVIESAKNHWVQSDDVFALLRAFMPGELQTIHKARPYLRPPYTASEVSFVVSQVKRAIDRISYQRLRYVADNDYSKDREDMACELTTYAVRLVRRYEIEADSYDHMVKLIARGITRHGINIAIRANRESRRILQRLVEQPGHRSAWWFDTVTMGIRKVEVPRHSEEDRRVLTYEERGGCDECAEDPSVCCEVVLKRDGTYIYAAVDHLYANRKEALTARLNHRRGRRSSRPHLLDLAPEVQDDFIPTTMSIHKTVGKDDSRNPMTMEDVIPDPVNRFEDAGDDFVKQLNQESSRLVREFSDCVLLRDPFFVDYLVDDLGLNLAEVTEKRLGAEACRFLEVRMQDVREELRHVPRYVWSSEKASQIYRQPQEA
jgi:hypothetical protein